MKRRGRKSASQTPSPKSDRIYGSKKNPPKSATSGRASSIKLNKEIIERLKKKLKEFKEEHPEKKNITLSDEKAVYRRGAGAYSSSHRPTISGGKPNTRNAWAMARVNKFLKKAGGEKVKKAYVQDDDLMKYEGGGEIISVRDTKYNSVSLKYIEDGIEKGYLNYYYSLHGVISNYIDEPPYNFKSEMYIEIVEVDEKYRNQGIAKKLIRKSIEDAKELNLDAITLRRDSGMGCYEGTEYDKYLKSIYTSLGFVQTWTKEEYEKSDYEKSPCSMYLKFVYEDGGTAGSDEREIFYERTYADGTTQKFNVEEYEKGMEVDENISKLLDNFSGKMYLGNYLGIDKPNYTKVLGNLTIKREQPFTLIETYKIKNFIENVRQKQPYSDIIQNFKVLDNVIIFETGKYEGGGQLDDKKAETYKKWKQLVNMSKSELKKFYDSEEGKEAGLSPSEAQKQGIDSGRESARWIMRMKDTPVKDWTPNMWKWAKKQISFISRMSGNKGKLYDDKGRKTRKHTSLLIWGHNPEK